VSTQSAPGAARSWPGFRSGSSFAWPTGRPNRHDALAMGGGGTSAFPLCRTNDTHRRSSLPTHFDALVGNAGRPCIAKQPRLCGNTCPARPKAVQLGRRPRDTRVQVGSDLGARRALSCDLGMAAEAIGKHPAQPWPSSASIRRLAAGADSVGFFRNLSARYRAALARPRGPVGLAGRDAGGQRLWEAIS